MKIGLGTIIAALVLLAAAAGGWAWYASRSATGETKYRIGKLERGPIQAVVVASGTLAAVTTVQVGSQISGQVLEIFARSFRAASSSASPSRARWERGLC